MTKSAFERFSSRTVSVYPGIRALEWTPRILDSKRKAFERQLSRDGTLRPEITEGNPSAGFRRAAQRSEYYPVQYIYPQTTITQNILGFDLGSSKMLAAAMKRTRDTDQPAAGQNIRLLERTGDGYGVPVMLPVFRLRPEGCQPGIKT